MADTDRATRIVYAQQFCVLHGADGIPYHVDRNSPWDADDPLVKRNPSFFSDEPFQIMRSQHPAGTFPVEQATRSPGEARRRVG